jgi:hypothetical protein
MRPRTPIWHRPLPGEVTGAACANDGRRPIRAAIRENVPDIDAAYDKLVRALSGHSALEAQAKQVRDECERAVAAGGDIVVDNRDTELEKKLCGVLLRPPDKASGSPATIPAHTLQQLKLFSLANVVDLVQTENCRARNSHSRQLALSNATRVASSSAALAMNE